LTEILEKKYQNRYVGNCYLQLFKGQGKTARLKFVANLVMRKTDFDGVKNLFLLDEKHKVDFNVY